MSKPFTQERFFKVLDDYGIPKSWVYKNLFKPSDTGLLNSKDTYVFYVNKIREKLRLPINEFYVDKL